MTARIHHISDFHITPGSREEHNAHRLVAHLRRHVSPDDVVILSGDVTDNGTREEYELAAELLEPLARECLVLTVPGNHDVGPKGVWWSDDAYNAYHEILVSALVGAEITAAAYPYVHEVGPVRVICVDSCHATRTRRTSLARGEVGYLQRRAVALELEAAQRRGLLTVVALHHHPFERGLGLELVDGELLLETLSHRCDLLVFGHKHSPAAWSDVYGVRRILASCKSTDTMRYRQVTLASERIHQEWVSVQE